MVASGICTKWRNKILGEMFGGTALAAEGNLYVGLCTSVNVDTGVVTGEHAIGQDGYARVELTNNTDTWTTPSAGVVKNKIVIEFPACSGNAWGALDTFFISKQAAADETGDTTIAYGTLDLEKTIGVGDTASFAAEAMQIKLDPTT